MMFKTCKPSVFKRAGLNATAELMALLSRKAIRVEIEKIKSARPNFSELDDELSFYLNFGSILHQIKHLLRNKCTEEQDGIRTLIENAMIDMVDEN